MQYVRELTLDINPKAKLQRVDVKQFDTESHVFNITIIDSAHDNVQIDVSGKTVNFRCLKPSGNACLYEGTANEDGTATVVLSAGTTEESGLALADISIEENGQVLSTAAFWLQVNKSGVSDHITEGNEYVTLIQTIEQAQTLIAELAGGATILCTDDGDGNVTIEFVPNS